ncbi:MAG: terminase large subunit domain-containing protein [Planctomycetota bacterium]
MTPLTGAATRLSKRALFETLCYEPHPGQLLLHRSHARHRVLACGTRWGKSTAAAMEAVADLLQPRDRSLAWVVAPTFDLTRRIFDRVVGVVQERLAHRIADYRPREHTISLTNMAGGVSVLKAKSADHPVGLLGEGLDFLLLDEAAQIPDEVWHEKLSPRLIDRVGSSLVLSTPQGGGWFFDAYKRGQRGRDPEYESWRSPSWDNPHLNRTVIEAERARLPHEAFAQQFEAEFIGVLKDPCETCGGPREDASGKVDALLGQNDDDFIPTCQACGMFTDEQGRCIVRKHNGWYASFQVDRDWPDFLESASYTWDDATGNCQWIQRTYLA